MSGWFIPLYVGWRIRLGSSKCDPEDLACAILGDADIEKHV